MTQLTPPESMKEKLTPAETVKPVETQSADGMIKISAEDQVKLDKQVASFIDQVVTSGKDAASFVQKVDAIHNLGSEDIRKAASMSNRMLDQPVRALKQGGLDENSKISKALVELRQTVEDLDPSGNGKALAPRRLFGSRVIGRRMRNYLNEYQSAQGQLDAIISSLYNGQDELRKDNATIEQEKENLWLVMERLQQYVYVGKQLDQRLDQRLAQIEVQDPEKARIVREEMQFYLRQKIQDLLTQLAVSIQGYLALDMIRKNNLELIKGVDRATTTTVSALRTGVMVAQALSNQRQVLDQINAVNSTTASIVEGTSELLKQQTANVHQQATSSSVDVETLQRAFDNVYESMDMIATYKQEALMKMGETVNLLSQEVTRTRGYLDKARAEQIESATKDLNLLEAEVPEADDDGNVIHL